MNDSEHFSVVQANLPAIGELHRRLKEFNLFDLLGTAHLELAHTRILVFLLNPHSQHGFESEFAVQFLQRVAATNEADLVRRYFDNDDLYSLDFSDIRRESQRIDLLAIDHVNRIVLIIENKIWSHEHSQQLHRYLEDLQERFPPSVWRLVPIYLTPKGEQPSHPLYLKASYLMVAQAVEMLLGQLPSRGDDVARIVLDQYARMVRRKIVNDWDAAAEAKTLYDQHPDAFEFIVRQKRYPQVEMQQEISRLVSETPILTKEPEEGTNRDGTISNVRFSHPAFDHLEAAERLSRTQQWTSSRRILLLQFDITDKRVELGLFVGPGPQVERVHLIGIARDAGDPFRLDLRISRAGNREWRGIYEHVLLNEKDFDDLNLPRITQLIRERWSDFLRSELAKVCAPFESAFPR